ncbi:MAG: ABC transporter permease [Firmicutes bacterium]|nr:ABC transporter permease [Candidatus Colimorpha enterica]
MKSGFFISTAWNNVKKNYRFFIPQILTGTGLLACLYIVFTLKSDKRIEDIPGGTLMPMFMSIGTFIISLLSVILILYTNSFIMRQRKREYGLYNVLGMEKKHIGRIMLAETAISGGISIVLGILTGLLFYKLCSLLICFLLKSDVVFGVYYISVGTIAFPALFFALIYFIAYIVNRISLAKMKPVELISSRKVGEKEPKVNWLLFVIGILTLAAGYIISVTTKDPTEAIILFFVAIILVMIGTYCLFISGSVFVLKALKKCRKYYYGKNHFISVSGLLYRMKQNAVGLASICILSTGVLCMISSTVSLYSGTQEVLDAYVDDWYIRCGYYDKDGEMKALSFEETTDAVREVADKHGLKISGIKLQKYLDVSYVFDGRTFSTERTRQGIDYSGICTVYFVTADSYFDMTGERLELKENEIAFATVGWIPGVTKTPSDTVVIHGKEYAVKNVLSSFPIDETGVAAISSTFGIVLPDGAEFDRIFQAQKNDYGKNASSITEQVAVKFEDRKKAVAVGKELDADMTDLLFDFAVSIQGNNGMFFNVKSYWEAQESVIGMYGSLLFLGIILGLVCLFAAVLIIYYKQISEGYEDREAYQIMKKVGMSDGEVMASIRSQTLTVFFLPLITAGVHLCFAFPIIVRILHVLLLTSTKTFVICALITYAVFAVIYTVIYSITAKTYYKIVH